MKAPLSCQIMLACDLFALSKSCIRIKSRVGGRAGIGGLAGGCSPCRALGPAPATVASATLALGPPRAGGQRAGSGVRTLPVLSPGEDAARVFTPEQFRAGLSAVGSPR